MMRWLGALIGASFVIAAAWASCHPSYAMDKWEGVYRVEGKNPNSSTYTGALQIEKVPGTSFYMLTWQMDADINADQVMVAFAYEHDNLLITTGANMLMLGSFRRDGGRWLVPNQNLTAPLTEKWTPSKAKTFKEALKPVKPTGHPPIGTRQQLQASR